MIDAAHRTDTESSDGADADHAEHLRLSVVESAHDVPESEWDALVRSGSVFLRLGWLRHVQDCFDLDLVFYLLRRGGDLVAAMPVLTLREPAEFPYHDPCEALFGSYELDQMKLALGWGRSESERLAAARLLGVVVRGEQEFHRRSLYPATVATSPFGFVGGVLAAPTEERPRVLELLLGEVARHEGEGGGVRTQAVLWQSEDDPELAQALTAAGYLSVLSDVEHDLDLSGMSSFDDYLATLEPQRARIVRREIRRFESSGARAESVPAPTGEDLDRVVALAKNHNDKYGLPFDGLRMSRFFELLLHDGSLGTSLHVIRPGDGVAGFLICLEADGVLYPKYIGFDPALVADTFAYFNLAYYHLIQTAIATGVTRIAYGMGSPDAKRRRGCLPSPVRSWFRCADPARARRLEPYVAVFNTLKRQVLFPDV